MIPEVEKFIADLGAITAEINEAHEAYYCNRDLTDDEYNKRRAAYIELRDSQYGRRDKLAARLVETTDDKLVQFIVKNYFSAYYHHTVRVLGRLPATLDELDELAAREGWCDVWFDAVDLAIESGVLEISDVDHMRYRVRRRLIRSAMHGDEVNRVMTLVYEYVELRIQDALATRIENASPST